MIPNNAAWVPYYRMACSIREAMQNQTISSDAEAFLNKIAEDFLSNVSEFHANRNNDFCTDFPHLYKGLIEYSRSRINAATLARFEEHLSGNHALSIAVF